MFVGPEVVRLHHVILLQQMVLGVVSFCYNALITIFLQSNRRVNLKSALRLLLRQELC